MIRGTNAEFRFNLPYNYNELDNAQVAFWQEGYNGPSRDRPLPIYKILTQCSCGSKPNELTVTLNQEETLRFTEKRKAKVQLRATTIAGTPFASKEEYISVYPVCDDSILDDEILPTPSDDGWVYLDGGIIE